MKKKLQTGRISNVPMTRVQSATIAEKHILLVDDDPQSLAMYAALLSEAGYQVDQANHALAAICSVVRHAPDLVLADIRMPIVDGKDLVRELKSHRDSQNIPVVALTGYDTPGMRKSALQAGYDDYITKPIDARNLLGQISKLILQRGVKHQDLTA